MLQPQKIRRKHQQVIYSDNDSEDAPTAQTNKGLNKNLAHHSPLSIPLTRVAIQPSSLSEDEQGEMPMINSMASEFSLLCRCGVMGDGNLESETQEFIQCEQCQNWSHIACQRDGRASSLRKDARFVCDECDMTQMKMDLQPQSAR